MDTDVLYYLFGTLIFIAVVLFIEGAYLTWNSSKGPEAGRIARRLRVMSAGAHSSGADISIVKERLLSESPMMQRLLLRVPRVGGVDRILQQSGLSWNVSTLFGATAAIFLVIFFAAGYLGIPLLVR